MKYLITTLALISSSALLLSAPSRAKPINANYSSPDYVTIVRDAMSDCRSTALALQKQASSCRRLVAGDPNKKCVVTLKGSAISVESAESLAAGFTSTASQLESQLPALELRQLSVNADERAIHALGFERTAKDFEEWEKLSKHEQDEFYRKLAEVALGNVLIGANQAVASAKSLNPWNAQKVIGKFKAARIEDPKLFAAIRRFAANSAKGKAVWIKDWQEVLTSIKHHKEVFFFSTGPGSHHHVDTKLMLEALASGLGLLVKNPVLELIVIDIQIGAAYLYGRRAVIEIEKLTALAETNLNSLKVLKKRLEDDWKDLKNTLNILPKPCSLS